jgi:hypothetical protein
LVYVKKFSKAALSALFKGLSRAISPLASALSSALALVLNLAFILAFLGAAAFSGQARADCQETSASADAAIEESRARYEYRGSFPDPAQTAQALDDCLSGLVGYPIDLSLDLGPLPNLSEITDRVCREARQAALNKIPLKTPVFVRAWIMKSAILSPTLPARIRKALE